MEGVSQEAASIAGHLKLSNLLWIYDNNHITIEGKTALAFSEDVGTRFEGYGWSVQHVSDANDLGLMERAVQKAIAETSGPSLIILDTHIAWGAPNKQDTAAAHGEPLGEEEIRLTKKFYGWPEDQHFFVPPEVYPHVRDAAVKRAAEAGATVTMPPWDAFWGARYARILDPFGHSWSFAHPLPAKG